MSNHWTTGIWDTDSDLDLAKRLGKEYRWNKSLDDPYDLEGHVDRDVG